MMSHVRQASTDIIVDEHVTVHLVVQLVVTTYMATVIVKVAGQVTIVYKYFSRIFENVSVS